MQKELLSKFDLTGKTALITGGAGFLASACHGSALIEAGAKVILTDWHEDRVKEKAQELGAKYFVDVLSYKMDVCDKKEVNSVVNDIYNKGMQIDILVNNAARNPKMSKTNQSITPESRFEAMTEEYFHDGMDASTLGVFLVTQAVTNKMLTHDGEDKGVVLNIGSDLSVIVNDNRLYEKEGLTPEQQAVKSITYSMSKHALLGFTKYLGVYFANRGIRVNMLSPSGVWNEDIPEDFVKKLSDKIPMGRMSTIEDYKAAVVFLCSSGSSYMVGQNVLIDGGKSLW